MDIRDLRPPVEDGPWPPITFLPPLTSGPLRGARSWVGLSYALIEGFRPLTMDVHVPQGPGPHPVVVWVHGGGYVGGDRRLVPLQWGQQSLFERLLAAGIAVATPDYRLVGEAELPAPVHDLVAAVRYLRRYADELGIDADRLGVWGESAGAHLGALAGLAGCAPEPDPWLVGEVGVGHGRADVSAIVAWYGVFDLTADPDLQELWPNATTAQRAEWAARCSPVRLLRSDSPSLLLMHGDRDGMVPVGQSIDMQAAAAAAGARCELVVVDGSDHVFLGVPIEPQWDRAIDFLLATL